MTSAIARPGTFLDTNILYPAGMRDIFLHISQRRLIDPKWSNDIGRELKNTFLKNRPDIALAWMEVTWKDMNRYFPNALVTDYEHLIPELQLPDPQDRHILAAAIVGACTVIVTANTRHFPVEVAQAHGLTVEHPDQFLRRLLDARPCDFCEAVRSAKAKLTKPPFTLDEYLAKREQEGLRETVAQLRQYTRLLE